MLDPTTDHEHVIRRPAAIFIKYQDDGSVRLDLKLENDPPHYAISFFIYGDDNYSYEFFFGVFRKVMQAVMQFDRS